MHSGSAINIAQHAATSSDALLLRLRELCAERLQRPRILVLKAGPSEDLLSVAPALRQLRAAFPKAEISLICNPATALAAGKLRIADHIRIYDTSSTAERFHDAAHGTFDIAVDLDLEEQLRPLLQHVDATLRCGFGSRRRFPFLQITLPTNTGRPEPPPIEADELVFAPGDFHSRMPIQTPFFHEIDFSVSDTHVVYGPYTRLPLGPLRANFAFELRAPAYSAARRLDLVLEVVCDQADNVVARHRIRKLASGQLTVAALEFINHEPGARYEFRAFLSSLPKRTRLRFFGVRVERLLSANQTSDESSVAPKPDRRAIAMVQLIVARVRELTAALRESQYPNPNAQSGPTWPLPFYSLVHSLLRLVANAPVIALPSISVVMIDDQADSQACEVTLLSLARQTFAPHQIFLVRPGGGENCPEPRGAIYVGVAEHDTLECAVNRVSREATGSHLILVKAGAVLAPAALTWFAVAIERTRAPLIYSDFETVVQTPSGQQIAEPVFQPAFDYDLLLQRNYIGNMFCIERSVYLSVDGFTSGRGLDRWHDLLLRTTEMLGRDAFLHLPQVLCTLPAITASSKAPERTIRTVQCHMDRIRSGARVIPHHDRFGRSLPDAASVLWPDHSQQRISVIVPTRDRVDLIFPLVSSLRRHAAIWERVEVIVMVNGMLSEDVRLGFAEVEHTFENVRVMYRPSSFNWCEINNAAASQTRGDNILLFLNDDMLCLTASWDARLAGQLMRPEIGIVGARLLYPHGTLQHAGLAISADGATAHEAAGDPADDGLYRDRTLLVHGTAIVTGAFLACRHDLFHELGGFDAQRYAITSGDADFCLRVGLAGRSVIYDPALTWIHYESVSRGYDQDNPGKQRRGDAEHAQWLQRFSDVDRVDLAGNPHLGLGSFPFASFHSLRQDEVRLWFEAQARRAEHWAAQSQRTGVKAGSAQGAAPTLAGGSKG
jgi:GT2 family glycosyltransferase